MVTTRSQTRSQTRPKILSYINTTNKYWVSNQFPPFCPQKSWDEYKDMSCSHRCALVTLDVCCGCEERGKGIRGFCKYCK